MKMFKRILSGMMAFLMVFGFVAAAAPKEVRAEDEKMTAYLGYADGAWGDAQYWGEEDLSATTYPNVTAQTAEVTGFGKYTIGLDFTKTSAGYANGMAFSSVMIKNAEVLHPGAVITVDEVKINGEAVELGEGFTTSDDGIETRYNLFNEWVSAIPDAARNATGDLTNATATPLAKDLCAQVETIEVTFTYAPGVVAFIDYANSDWSVQAWSGASDNGVVADMTEITGAGTYTSTIDFTGTANGYVDGIAFSALMVERGELTFPKYAVEIDKVEVNGEEVEVGKYFTTSDNGVATRVNLYNEWCGHDENGVVVADAAVARRADGDLENVTPMPLAKDVFNGVEILSITYTLAAPQTRVYAEPDTTITSTVAYLGFADGAWSDAQYWGDADVSATGYPNVTFQNAEVTGFGTYTVGVDFTKTANGKAAGGAAFSALMIKDLEQMLPGACITVDKVVINGEEVTCGTAYTSSDDGRETRANLFNEWVTDLPEDARTAAGSLKDATPTPLTKEQLTDVATMEVTFTLSPYTTASINYVDGSWNVQYWGGAPEGGVVVSNPVIYKPGTYTASIDFTGTEAGSVDGISFAALMLDRGEIAFPYAVLNIDEIKVNGEAIAYTAGYTTTDDTIATRVNLFNDWVSELPDDVRTKDGSREVSAKMIDPAVMNGVKTIEITFTFIEGEAPVVVEKPVYTADKDGVYHAYLLLQSENWSFRNKQSDATYGRESNAEAFGQISLVADDGTLQKKQGTIVDAEIKGNGTYSVGLKDFNLEDASTLFNLLGFSTDIPDDEAITFTDVKIKMDGRTVYTFDNGFRDPDDAKLGLITILAVNKWNNGLTADYGFSYNFPTENIEIEFTVGGFNYDNTGSSETPSTETPDTESPEATKAPEPTVVPTTAPSTDTDAPAESGSNTVVIVIVVIAVLAIAGGAVFFFMKKKNK